MTLRINASEDKLVPVVFMRVNDMFESRLQVVRAGAAHYFMKPINMKLHALTLEDGSQTKPNQTKPILFCLIYVLMLQCNGIELVTLIRQHREYDLIPIVFLTTEWRKEIKLESINLDSDDFMPKPISPWYLVGILKARILRAETDKIKKF